MIDTTPCVVKVLTTGLLIALQIGGWAQVQLLNDEFGDANTLPNWLNINHEESNPITQLEDYNIDDSTAGHFFIKPLTESWFDEYRGALLFKYISGDFVLTTEVTATGRDGSSLPSSDFSLAGLMIREPVDNPDPDLDMLTGQQNFIFMSIGQANGVGWNFEIKNTCNSRSCLNIDDIATNISLIRLVRRGDQIIVLSQLPGGNWEIRGRYDRSGVTACRDSLCNPFSDTVQIGLVAYTDWDKIDNISFAYHNTQTLHPDSLTVPDPFPMQPFNPDIIANYDFARFDSLIVPAQFSGSNLANPAEVSDAELLSFLAYNSEPFCPPTFHIYDPIAETFLETSAAQIITSTSVISGQSNVTFGASQEISLQPGFEINGNSVFEIILSGCP